MKNVGIIHKRVFLPILCVIFGIFVFSCGLEEVLTIDDPVVTYNDPVYSSADPLTWYFNFAPSSDNGEFFLGTEVYYKIYNNYSDLVSQRSAILSVNSATNSSAAATRMIETYTYQTLGTSKDTDNIVFVPADVGTGRMVIRLKTYQDGLGTVPTDTTSEEYKTYLKNLETRYNFVACIGQLEGTEYVYKDYIPMRNGNAKSFDFFDYNETNNGVNVVPVFGDTDYKHNSSFSEENCYYVQMFAVGVAIDTTTVSNSYSLVLNLGSVPIRKGE